MLAKSDEELEKIINEKEFVTIGLKEYLSELLLEKSLVKKQVVKDSHISQNYIYQIFNGRRNPQRDKVIMLAFGMKLNVSETLELLKVAEVSMLYETNKRDLIILHSIKHKKSIIECNILLHNGNFNVLE